MPDLTAVNAIPYPQAGENANGPLAFGAIATRMETLLKERQDRIAALEAPGNVGVADFGAGVGSRLLGACLLVPYTVTTTTPVAINGPPIGGLGVAHNGKGVRVVVLHTARASTGTPIVEVSLKRDGGVLWRWGSVTLTSGRFALVGGQLSLGGALSGTKHWSVEVVQKNPGSHAAVGDGNGILLVYEQY